MKASSRRMWMGVIGLALLAAPAAGSAQRSSAFHEERGTTAQATPARLTLDLDDVSLRDALKTISSRSGVSLAYSASSVPLERRVTLHLRDATVPDALREALRGTDVDVREAPNGQLMLVRRAEHEEVPLPPDFAPGSITGRVTDSASHVAVIRAVVSMDGDARHAMTDDAGRYRLGDVAAGAHTLTVRRIGYAPAERLIMVPDGATVVADFALAAVASRLNEVITTVTGPQRRLEVGNVIGVIDADSLVREAPIANLGELINARVPGAQVLMNGGLTGSSPRIRIRGINSITAGNDPLVIIDGVRVENSSSVFAGYGQTSGRLNDLNPEEIESIEIAKGPSAATLYGTDAANGVIVVKTKRGRPGPPTWNAYAELGRTDLRTHFPDNYYSWGHTATGAVRQCVLTQMAIGACSVDSLTTFNPLLDPATSPFAAGMTRQYGLQLSGGAAQARYFLAGEFSSDDGFLRMPGAEQQRVRTERGGGALPPEQVRPNALRKVSLRGNTDATLGPKADVGLLVGISSIDARIPGNSVFFDGINGKGYRDANDGWFNARPGELFGIRNTEHVTHLTGSLRGSWRPLAWLSGNATVGTDLSSTLLDALQRRNEGTFGSGRNGRRQNARTNVQLYTVDLGLSAHAAPTPRLTSRTSAGVQYNRRQLGATMVTATNLPIGSETVTGAAVTTGQEQNVQSVVAGAYLEQEAALDNRLFLTLAMRADGAASFGRDFRTAFYPKASASWLVAGGGSGVLSTLRLRAAYGVSGVQPASTAALALVSVFPVLVDGVVASGGALSAIGNPNLQPERQSELEGGVDAALFGERIRIELTGYSKLSRDALINRPLPTSLGYGSRLENVGAVSNRGIEWMVSARAVERPIVSWDVALNGSANRNRLERMGAPIPYIGTRFYRSQEGHPLFGLWEIPITGFADANGDGVIQASEVQVGDSAVFLGSSVPTRQLTATTTLSLWNRARVSTQLDYRGGFWQVDNDEGGRCSALLDCRAVNDPSTPLDQQAAAVAVTSTALGRTSFGYARDASFVRWRELSVSVDLPARVASMTRASRGTLVLAGRNLRLFGSHTALDPETNGSLNLAEGFINSTTAPPARSLIVRLNLGF